MTDGHNQEARTVLRHTANPEIASVSLLLHRQNTALRAFHKHRDFGGGECCNRKQLLETVPVLKYTAAEMSRPNQFATTIQEQGLRLSSHTTLDESLNPYLAFL